jgi:hypothetical protein
MAEHDLMGRFLGVYPRMLVTGSPVGEAQAMEIIRRTDRLFGSLTSNDYPYLVRLARQLRIPLWEQYDPRGDGDHQAALRRWEEAHRRWLAAWGYIETEYVTNDWISDQFPFGPHGWCHPDGTIGHIDRVGKGQVAEEVYSDWCRLSQAFPFLDLGVSLAREGRYEGEMDAPQVGFLVRGGQVQVVDPEAVDVHAGHQPPTRGGPTSRYSSSSGEQSAEDNLAALHTISQIFGPAPVKRMIAWEWIEAWAAHAPEQDVL